MLQEVNLRNLRYGEYWIKPYKHWGVKTWTSFFQKNNPNAPPRIVLNSFAAELKVLISNLQPETREFKKASSLKDKLEVSHFHVFIMWKR